MEVFGDGPLNAASCTFPRPTPDAMATKFGTKLAITLCKRYLRDFCVYMGAFGNGQANSECCQSNFTLTDPRCNGNEIWDKMGYNSSYVRDISEILASNKRFLRVEQINNFIKSTMVDNRCLGNKIFKIFAKNWLKLG